MAAADTINLKTCSARSAPIACKADGFTRWAVNNGRALAHRCRKQGRPTSSDQHQATRLMVGPAPLRERRIAAPSVQGHPAGQSLGQIAFPVRPCPGTGARAQEPRPHGRRQARGMSRRGHSGSPRSYAATLVGTWEQSASELSKEQRRRARPIRRPARGRIIVTNRNMGVDLDQRSYLSGIYPWPCAACRNSVSLSAHAGFPNEAYQE